MTEPPTRIVGIILIRNEDLFIEQVILNVIDFCDRLIVADNRSTDETFEIVQRLARRFPHLICHRIDHPRESHPLIEEYAGTRTWVFGVDGDEIYDPAGLAKLRTRLLAGEYDDQWLLLGNMLHCVALDLERLEGRGYLAPPCRSVSKLYNFSIISQWSDCPQERLHSGNLVFKPGYDATLRLPLYEAASWEESEFRCLHTCFMVRSSLEQGKPGQNGVTARKNPAELVPFQSFKGCLRSVWYKLKGIDTGASWKSQWYMKGELSTKAIAPFFRQSEPAG